MDLYVCDIQIHFVVAFFFGAYMPNTYERQDGLGKEKMSRKNVNMYNMINSLRGSSYILPRKSLLTLELNGLSSEDDIVKLHKNCCSLILIPLKCVTDDPINKTSKY